MSTTSFIGVKRKDGSVKAIYCHNDGYFSHNGLLLCVCYNSLSAADELINLGDLSCLGSKIGVKVDFDTYYKDDKKQCVAYHRDRDEDLNIREFSSVKDYAEKVRAYYTYLFDGEWKHVSRDGKTEPLKDAIIEEFRQNIKENPNYLDNGLIDAIMERFSTPEQVNACRKILSEIVEFEGKEPVYNSVDIIYHIDVAALYPSEARMQAFEKMSKGVVGKSICNKIDGSSETDEMSIPEETLNGLREQSKHLQSIAETTGVCIFDNNSMLQAIEKLSPLKHAEIIRKLHAETENMNNSDEFIRGCKYALELIESC